MKIVVFAAVLGNIVGLFLLAAGLWQPLCIAVSAGIAAGLTVGMSREL